MTDKIDHLRLGAGTVPDPFGLAEGTTPQVSREETPDQDTPGTTPTEGTGQGEGAVTDEAQAVSVRLGELD